MQSLCANKSLQPMQVKLACLAMIRMRLAISILVHFPSTRPWILLGMSLWLTR